MAFRLLGGVRGVDLLAGVLGATAIQWGSLAAFGATPRDAGPETTPENLGSVPVTVVTVTRGDAKSPRLKLGGGTAHLEARQPFATANRQQESQRPLNSKPRALEELSPAPHALDRVIHERVSASSNAQPRAVPAPALSDKPEGAESFAASSDVAADSSGESRTDAPAGEGFPDGLPDGSSTDPLAARAIRLYRERLIAWLSARFRVSGSGLSAFRLEQLRVRARVRIDSERRVAGFSFTPSGEQAFDDAALAALQAVDGLEVPPPPEHYPGLLQREIHVTFVCRQNHCD